MSFWRGKRVFVTGHAGFKGSWLVIWLEQMGAEIFGYSLGPYTNDDNYREQWLYSNYDLELGAPLGARYQDGDAWVRDFANGSVKVNPLTQVATITMN